MSSGPAVLPCAASSSVLALCLFTSAYAEEAPYALNVVTRVSPEVLAPVNTPTSNVEQTLWARRGKLAVGVQWQGRVQNIRPDAPVSTLSRNDASTSLHMGLSVDVTERARVELTRPMDAGAGNRTPLQVSNNNSSMTGTSGSGGVPGTNGMRLSLELKSPKPMSGLRNGLRFAVTSQSQLMLKPRRGGIAVHYNGTF